MKLFLNSFCKRPTNDLLYSLHNISMQCKHKSYYLRLTTKTSRFNTNVDILVCNLATRCRTVRSLGVLDISVHWNEFLHEWLLYGWAKHCCALIVSSSCPNVHRWEVLLIEWQRHLVFKSCNVTIYYIIYIISYIIFRQIMYS